MRSCLDERTAAQIAARFITKQSGVDTRNYTKLMKLMYLVERESLSRWNKTLTGDLLSWMDMGPVLSGVLDRIRHAPFPKALSSWTEWFETDGYELRLVGDPGTDLLAKPVLDLIDGLHERFKDYSYGQLVNHLHRILPENPHPEEGSSLPIDYEAILEAVGKGDASKRIARTINTTNFLKSKISGH